jgi:DNA polymerase I-like protein with 3'-5' exonuclease and polymerase domains
VPDTAPTLAPAMRRARRDPIARLLASATAHGIKFRFSGATLQIAGADTLHRDDRALLRQYIEDIRLRLEPPAPEHDLLADIEIEVIIDADRAQEVLDGLGAAPLGLDVETAPIASNGDAQPWIRITRAGHRAVRQPRSHDDSGLDPRRARPRIVQLFVPAEATVFIFDMACLPFEILRPLEDKRLFAHVASFEAGMLAACGIQLRRLLCTRQMAALVLGAERGGLKLAEVAQELLGVEVDKGERLSDWGAARLSESQYTYAALDSVLTHRIAATIWPDLDAETRRAFKLGAATLLPVTGMRLAGVPFRQEIHEATIAEWERAYSTARGAFTAITGTEIPPSGPQRSAWLERRLPEDMLAWWPRTEGNQLRTRSSDLERLAAVPEARPLLDIIHWDKRLRAFGHTLLDRTADDGRLYMDLKPVWTKSGRCGCSSPNLQQLPQDVRRAVMAQPGSVLIIADYNQTELKIAAELSGDEAMRQIFRDDQDMHTLNAAAFLGIAPEDVTATQRNTAKRIGFGTLYGSGPRGLVASAWSMYRIEMSEAEAQAYKEWFYDRYPRLRQWQGENADQARGMGALRSVVGRPLMAAWEGGRLGWPHCCNYRVQASASDVMMLAMIKVHAALEGRASRMILQVHDELVIETNEMIAAEVAALVEQHMVAAYVELFPAAPRVGLVDVATRPCWAKAPKASKNSPVPSGDPDGDAPGAGVHPPAMPAPGALEEPDHDQDNGTAHWQREQAFRGGSHGRGPCPAPADRSADAGCGPGPRRRLRQHPGQAVAYGARHANVDHARQAELPAVADPVQPVGRAGGWPTCPRARPRPGLARRARAAPQGAASLNVIQGDHP